MKKFFRFLLYVALTLSIIFVVAAILVDPVSIPEEQESDCNELGVYLYIARLVSEQVPNSTPGDFTEMTFEENERGEWLIWGYATKHGERVDYLGHCECRNGDLWLVDLHIAENEEAKAVKKKPAKPQFRCSSEGAWKFVEQSTLKELPGSKFAAFDVNLVSNTVMDKWILEAHTIKDGEQWVVRAGFRCRATHWEMENLKIFPPGVDFIP